MPKVSKFSAEIKQRILNYLEKYCDAKKFNIAAATYEFSMLESRLRVRV